MAAECYSRSLQFFSDIDNKREQALVLWKWAQYEIKQGNKKQGRAMWQEAKDIFTNLNLPLMLTRMEADAQK